MDIRLSGVSHSYGGTEVLRDIALDVPAGRIVCIVGPSGCGKSTLLRMIGGLERPAEGAVLQIGDPPAGCLNPLTYIFQDFALLPWRTVRRQHQPGAGRSPAAPVREAEGGSSPTCWPAPG